MKRICPLQALEPMFCYRSMYGIDRAVMGWEWELERGWNDPIARRHESRGTVTIGGYIPENYFCYYDTSTLLVWFTREQ